MSAFPLIENARKSNGDRKIDTIKRLSENQVELVKNNGNTFVFVRYGTYGIAAIGVTVKPIISTRTKARILKEFYPHETLKYLAENGKVT